MTANNSEKSVVASESLAVVGKTGLQVLRLKPHRDGLSAEVALGKPLEDNRFCNAPVVVT